MNDVHPFGLVEYPIIITDEPAKVSVHGEESHPGEFIPAILMDEGRIVIIGTRKFESADAAYNAGKTVLDLLGLLQDGSGYSLIVHHGDVTEENFTETQVEVPTSVQ